MKYTGLQLRLEALRVKHARHKRVRKIVMASRLATMLPGMIARNGIHYTLQWFRLRYGPASGNSPNSRSRLESLLNIWIEGQGGHFLAFTDVSNLPEDRSEILSQLDKVLEDFPHSVSLEYDVCIDFYHYFLFFGDLRIAARFRELATGIIIHEQQSSTHLLPEAVKAALELGQAETALQWINEKDLTIIPPDLLDALTAHAHTLIGNKAEALRYWEARYSPEDRQYAEFLRGKSIAIVGPATPEGEPGEEIDSFDIIIRTNFNSSKPPDARVFGSRTDVSYYNYATILYHPEQIKSAAPSLCWVNLKVPAVEITEGRNASEKNRGTRPFFVPESIFPFGYPNAIPCILFDLLAFEPERIKLFGVNFFASANSYSSHYAPSSGDSSSQTISSALRKHDPFSQLNFVASHLRGGLILADSLSGEILALNMSTYAERLHRTYDSSKI